MSSARDYLNDYLSKAKTGAGSRGGRVIGYYRSGKAIYSNGKGGEGGVHTHPVNLGSFGENLSSGADGSYMGIDKNKKDVMDMHEKHFSDHSAQDHEDAAEAHDDKTYKMAMGDGADKHPDKFNAHIAARNFHAMAAHHLGGKQIKEGGGGY